MQVKDIELLISAVAPAQYPKNQLPEIAMAGRSNVGKSSVINRLVQRKGFARTSSQPGKTQTLNFYQINQDMNLVDVPGYGYAKVSKKQREQFGKICEAYFQERETLKGVILLVDGRHDPSEDDQLMYDFIRYYERPILVVATKMDKVTRNHQAGSLQRIRKVLQVPKSDLVLPSSALANTGYEDIWRWIEQRIAK
ncbi:ribosome biogenesis GTP-binding protein YihA/YsxC [Lapidilactobacillus wuchangensis]|uniref:ribosome biogenesis GTP-binding protein YihA/YsxC n=1 Tax=Lapidilactobacillus wuchangensis TaxID=2486001 RepID=UPI000F7864A3|nr:ribosome biogenesis GTP-binding protein YihA/YsxC [Lapidilactobacillus wuchangensis]